jgi:hypothetical protein
MDYNCVIKTIKIINDEGIWDSDEALDYIKNNYDASTLPYGQVIHVYNENPSGDEWNEYYVAYDGKIINTHGDQYFRLHYDFTKNITDICAKYPEYCITSEKLGCCLPKELESDEYEYQMMNGFINGRDKFVTDKFGFGFDNNHYTVYIDESEFKITNTDSNQTMPFEYDEIGILVDIVEDVLKKFTH